MNRPSPRPRHALASLALASLALVSFAAALPGAAAEAAPAGPALDPTRVGWSEIRMTATKLFITATAQVSLRTLPGPAVIPDLLPFPGGGGVEPGPEVLEMVYAAAGAGRRSQSTLLMDPVSGAALQTVHHELEGKPRFRTYRFGDRGAYHRTRWPTTKAEMALPPAEWSRATEGLRAYPDLPGPQPVIDTTGLLYVLSAAALDKPGDHIEVLVFRRRDTQTVRVEVLPPREIPVQYEELWPKGSIARRGKLMPIRLALRGVRRPASPGAPPETRDAGLELLGLQGQLEVALDPETRAPVQISGSVKILGDVTLRLAALRPR